MAGGLSTASFMDGAMKGFSFMQGLQDRQAAQEYRKQSGLLRAAQLQGEQIKMQNEIAKGQRETQSAPIENAYKQAQTAKVSQEVEQRMNELNAEMLYHAEKNGLPYPVATPEQQKYFNEHSPTSSMAYILHPDTVAATQTFGNVMNGDVHMNDPEAHAAMDVLAPEIQRGTKVDGKLRTNSIVPAPDGKSVFVGVQHTAPDGTVNDHGVITEGRTSDPRDPVKPVSLDALIGRGAMLGRMQADLGDPAVRKSYIETYYKPDKNKEPVTFENAYHTDPETGITYQVDSRGQRHQATPPKDKEGGGSSGTQRQKDYQFAVDKLGMDTDSALQWAESHGSISKEAHDYARHMVNLDTGNGQEKPEGYDAEAAYGNHYKKFMDQYNTFKPASAPKGGDETPPPQPFKNGAGPRKLTGQEDAGPSYKGQLDAIKQANPGKSDAWAKAYLQHLTSQQ